MSIKFKIGDHIKKIYEPANLLKENQIFKIIDLKEIKGGNWHDGFSVSIIATLESIISNDKNPETETEEYCVQYINCMCQINNIYAMPIDIMIFD